MKIDKLAYCIWKPGMPLRSSGSKGFYYSWTIRAWGCEEIKQKDQIAPMRRDEIKGFWVGSQEWRAYPNTVYVTFGDESSGTALGFLRLMNISWMFFFSAFISWYWLAEDSVVHSLNGNFVFNGNDKSWSIFNMGNDILIFIAAPGGTGRLDFVAAWQSCSIWVFLMD